MPERIMTIGTCNFDGINLPPMAHPIHTRPTTEAITGNAVLRISCRLVINIRSDSNC